MMTAFFVAGSIAAVFGCFCGAAKISEQAWKHYLKKKGFDWDDEIGTD